MKRWMMLCLCVMVVFSFSKEEPAVSPVKSPGIAQTEKTLYLVQQNGKYGYIDKTGRLVIPPQFDYALDFSEDLAPVTTNDGWGYIDKSGKYIITTQCVWVSYFSEGLAVVELGDKFGYINKSGKYIVTPQFEWPRDFSNGLAMVVLGHKCGYIDKSENTSSLRNLIMLLTCRTVWQG